MTNPTDDAGTTEPVVDIVDLVRRDATRVPDPYDVTDGSLVVVKVRDDERLEVRDLEAHLPDPVRARGTVTVHEPDDFTRYVNRLAAPYPDPASVWADVKSGCITAVLNDHAHTEQAGWRDHTVKLVLQPDQDWTRWAQADGRPMDQASFAEFIEDVYHTVVEPDAATMLEVASTMTAKKSVEFSQGTRLQTGDVQLRFEETTQANAGTKGQLEIPERITVLLAPWRGVEPRQLDARLRYRIEHGRLLIGYKLLRPDVFRDEVFTGLIERITDDLTVPLYRGEPPAPLRT